VSWEAKVLTVSDSVHAGTAADRSGPEVASYLEHAGFRVVGQEVVPDGVEPVTEALRRSTRAFTGLVITTGGTGFAPRDLTPEATARVLERHAPGLAEAMRRSHPKAALSRGLAGTVGRCLVLNLPGSPTAAVECLGEVIDLVPHALALLAGEDPHPQPAAAGGSDPASAS
jgi:molybdenum cofactor synthesis domain-containing protein